VAGSKVIKVGSRGSALALCQTEEVLGQLRPLYPKLKFQVIPLRTHGDTSPTTSLVGMGMGIFTSEIETELLAGRLDMAVHSLKDLPVKLSDGLTLGATLRRRDARDVLVNRWHCPLGQLRPGARIGTSSPRREAQFKSCCPTIIILPIRGNVESRISKAQGGDYDGVVLAAAGLDRLGLTHHIAQYLAPQQFVPAPGQGVVAIEVRKDDVRMLNLVRPVEHPPTRMAITSERAFLETLGGGCQMPVGAYARVQEENMFLTVFLGAPNGQKPFRAKLEGMTHDPLQLASDAYLAVIERGGEAFLIPAQVELD
jgi:hydroxymethylbilane synthase